ncbi:hypothetical protein TIFTF001_013254 [Ficus carica]|uniref:Small ribosomal subunit protein mS41 SAM domain-containing protein n=1 Tax=Ficus carica TaxID=3494 RepID=A0AA88D730_FICCA|nr:hypothetical protein TIFTF001_013254 [Ficus carica]
MAWRQILFNNTAISAAPSTSSFSRFFSKSIAYEVKVGIPEFLKGIGKGVETHVPKLESEIGDFQKLLVTRTLKLKKLGIPCKHRKLILKYSHKYRVGLWRPRAEPAKSDIFYGDFSNAKATKSVKLAYAMKLTPSLPLQAGFNLDHKEVGI